MNTDALIRASDDDLFVGQTRSLLRDLVAARAEVFDAQRTRFEAARQQRGDQSSPT